MDETTQKIPLPASTPTTEITQLGYVDSFDAPTTKTYAYLAYKETNPTTGAWIIKIKANNTAGTTIDPNNVSFQKHIDEAVSKQEPFALWGFQFATKEDDPRIVENRVFFDEGRKPTHIELHLRTRNPDNTPTDEQVLRIDWPQ
jgi:hypothetical protein